MDSLQLSLLEEDTSEEMSETIISNGEIQYVEIKKLNQNHWVTKHNDLIESTYKLTLQQQRILVLIASRVQPTDDTFKLYRFNTKDVIDILGLKSSSNYYNQIKEIVNGLQKETLTIKSNGRERNYSWVITSDYVDQQGYFLIQLHPSLMPYFLELKEKFTQYRIGNVLSLTSSYAIRIYELLKQYEGLGRRTFGFEELKNLLSIEPTKYQKYSHFKERVLLPSQKDLIEHTDISFVYDVVKTGRKITKLEFTIRSNIKKNPLITPMPDSDDSIEKVLNGFGLKQKQIANVIKNYSEKDIFANIAYTNERMLIGNVKNPGAYFMKAIKDNFAGNKPMFTKASESVEKRNALKVDKGEYEKEHFGRSPVEFEKFLLAGMALMNEETAKRNVTSQLREYLVYQEKANGYLIPPSKFTDERIKSIYKEVLVEL